MEIVLYSEKYDELIVLNPQPPENKAGVKVEAASEMMKKIVNAHLDRTGFIFLDDWVYLGVEIE